MVPMTLSASSSDRNSGLSSPQIRGNHSLGLIRSGPMATAVRKPSRLESAMLLSGAPSDVRNSSSSWRLIGAAWDNAFMQPAPFVRVHGAHRRVLSGLAPLPLADNGSVGYRAASHRGADEDAVLGLWVAGRDGAAGAHRPGLPPVPLSCVRQAVQRALRHSAEPDPVSVRRH